MAGYLEMHKVLIREVSLDTVFDWIDTHTLTIKRRDFCIIAEFFCRLSQKAINCELLLYLWYFFYP